MASGDVVVDRRLTLRNFHCRSNRQGVRSADDVNGTEDEKVPSARCVNGHVLMSVNTERRRRRHTQNLGDLLELTALVRVVLQARFQRSSAG